MFPVPVRNATGASQSFGEFKQHQEDRQREQDDPDSMRREEEMRAAALAHEGDIEQEIRDIEHYENTHTLSSSHPTHHLGHLAKPGGDSVPSSSNVEDESHPGMEGVNIEKEREKQRQEREKEKRDAASTSAIVSPFTATGARHCS